MKSTSLQITALGIAILSVCSCEVQDDSIGVDIQSEKSKEKSSKLTCEDLFKAPEDFEGKTITLDAINWGLNTSSDGEEIFMSIDDEALLGGLQQAHVLVHFTKDQEEEIKKIKENDSISLTATVGTIEFGALRLVDAKINPN